MLFVSNQFVVFLAVTLCAYYFLARSARQQLVVLVGASLFFYAYANFWLLGLLLSCALIATLVSHVVAKQDRPSHFWIVAAGTVFMLGVLALFKYKVLFYETLLPGKEPSEPVRYFLNLALPIGISFYTFHAISLMVDTYTRKTGDSQNTPFLKRLGETLLYTVFFPQLVAGPITKARDFLPQIKEKRLGDVDPVYVARTLIVGFFLKLVIADNLAAETAWIIYPNFEQLPGSKLIWLLIGFSCQIFADFAGYSLIAIGLAALFGYKLPANFNRPYIADSFSEFWRRWHMSLSAWLRDYLYIPLGGDRKGRHRTYLNLLMVMVLGGLWHGAAWNFAGWGLLHGVALAVERPFRGTRFFASQLVLLKCVRMALVFTVVTIGWLAFKLHDLGQILAYFEATWRNFGKGAASRDLLALQFYCALVFLYHVWPMLTGFVANRDAMRMSEQAVFAVMLCGLVLNSGIPTSFIYFQF